MIAPTAPADPRQRLARALADGRFDEAKCLASALLGEPNAHTSAAVAMTMPTTILGRAKRH